MHSHPSRMEFNDFEKLTPATVGAIRSLNKVIEESGLEKSLLELVKLRASQLNGCAFCAQIHLNVARKHGVPAEKLDLAAVWRDAGIFSEREQAALAWTERLTLVAQQGVTDAAFQAAREQFSELELANLSVAIGLINLWNRLGVAYAFPPPILHRPAAGSAA